MFGAPFLGFLRTFSRPAVISPRPRASSFEKGPFSVKANRAKAAKITKFIPWSLLAVAAILVCGSFGGALRANPISLAIPASAQGPGNSYVTADVGSCCGTLPNQCYTYTIDSCTQHNTSSGGDSETGEGLGYIDSAGLHSLASAESGTGHVESWGDSYYSTSITNISNMNVQFQLTFQLDGEVSSDSSNAIAYQQFKFFTVSNPVCYYDALNCEATATNSWIFSAKNDNSDIFSESLQTSSIDLAPGQSIPIYLFLQSYALAYQGSIALADASNTLSITGFAATDMSGNPLPASDFVTADGASLSSIDTNAPSAPEPAGFLLAGTGLLLLGGLHRRRR